MRGNVTSERNFNVVTDITEMIRSSNMLSDDLWRVALVVAFHYVACLVALAVVGGGGGGVGGGAALASPLVFALYAFVALSKLLALKSGARQKHLTFANVDNLHCPMPTAINLTPPRPTTSSSPPPQPTSTPPRIHLQTPSKRGEWNSTEVASCALNRKYKKQTKKKKKQNIKCSYYDVDNAFNCSQCCAI